MSCNGSASITSAWSRRLLSRNGALGVSKISQPYHLTHAHAVLPVVTKVLEPSEDLKNTHTYNEKKVSKSPKR
ncbi:unnamed protein product [Ectocarpus sp. CCAP 1310/34]|nr:unnamed protein product [Ectocarpus sp. CCAP 1310/34]